MICLRSISLLILLVILTHSETIEAVQDKSGIKLAIPPLEDVTLGVPEPLIGLASTPAASESEDAVTPYDFDQASLDELNALINEILGSISQPESKD